MLTNTNDKSCRRQGQWVWVKINVRNARRWMWNVLHTQKIYTAAWLPDYIIHTVRIQSRMFMYIIPTLLDFPDITRMYLKVTARLHFLAHDIKVEWSFFTAKQEMKRFIYTYEPVANIAIRPGITVLSLFLFFIAPSNFQKCSFVVTSHRLKRSSE